MTMPSPRIIAAIVFVVLVLLVVAFGPSACQKIRSLNAQSKVDRAQSGAFHNSASDAVETVGNVSANQSAGEDLTRSNSKEIRDAEGASDRVNPAVRDAGLDGLCRRAAYANDERCRLRRSAPK